MHLDVLNDDGPVMLDLVRGLMDAKDAESAEMGSGTANRRFVMGVVATLGGAVLWGFSGACAQLMLGGIGASALFITAARAVIAAVLLMGLALVRYRREVAQILRCGTFGFAWCSSELGCS